MLQRVFREVKWNWKKLNCWLRFQLKLQVRVYMILKLDGEWRKKHFKWSSFFALFDQNCLWSCSAKYSSSDDTSSRVNYVLWFYVDNYSNFWKHGNKAPVLSLKNSSVWEKRSHKWSQHKASRIKSPQRINMVLHVLTTLTFNTSGTVYTLHTEKKGDIYIIGFPNRSCIFIIFLIAYYTSI